MNGILFVLENIEQKCGANIEIEFRLIKEISKREKVFILAGRNKGSNYKINNLQNVEYIETVVDHHVNIIKSSIWNQKSLFEKFVTVLKHPYSLLICILKKTSYGIILSKEYKREIDNICKKNDIDMIISFSLPYYLPFAAAKSCPTCKKILLQFDPFSNNKNFPFLDYLRRRIIEQYTILRTDKVYVLSCFYNDFIRLKTKVITDRIFPMEIPFISNEGYAEKQSSSGECINFVYCGFFYKKIRNPEFMFVFFSKLRINYVLHIIGGGEECDDLISEYKNILGDKLKVYGVLDNKKALLYMKNMDILVNLNNTIKNQIPSKLFQYINTGLPILNICSNTDDISVEYLKRYNNAITIYCSGDIDMNIERVERFACSPIKREDYQSIEQKYYENTIPFFASKLLQDSIIS